MVVIFGMELYAGNIMFCVFSICTKEPNKSWKRLALDLTSLMVWTFIGNFIGGVATAYFMTILPGHCDDPKFTWFRDAIIDWTMSKLERVPWYRNFWRGVGCNTFVCMGVLMSQGADTISGKLWVVFWPVAVCSHVSPTTSCARTLPTSEPGLCMLFLTLREIGRVRVCRHSRRLAWNIPSRPCIAGSPACGCPSFCSFYSPSGLFLSGLSFDVTRHHRLLATPSRRRLGFNAKE